MCFLYLNMLSICSDMSDMFCTHLVCFISCILLIMLLIMYSIRFCYVLVSYVCFDLVSVPVCISSVSVSVSIWI
ncbi:hypothetical protein Hdeb2414_s0012g00392881 [Helianthus debilis subsp. tardiflorus]